MGVFIVPGVQLGYSLKNEIVSVVDETQKTPNDLILYETWRQSIHGSRRFQKELISRLILSIWMEASILFAFLFTAGKSSEVS
jgi:hypothetical protein